MGWISELEVRTEGQPWMRKPEDIHLTFSRKGVSAEGLDFEATCAMYMTEADYFQSRCRKELEWKEIDNWPRIGNEELDIKEDEMDYMSLRPKIDAITKNKIFLDVHNREDLHDQLDGTA